MITALVLYLFLLLTMTLAHKEQAEGTPVSQRLNLTPFATIVHDLGDNGRGFWINLVGNVVVFTPLGAAIASLAPRRARALHAMSAGFALSLSIETLQFVIGRRIAAVDAVTLNTLGASLGFFVVDALRRLRSSGAARI